MTDPNITAGKHHVALGILGEYVRHGIECGSARNLDCDCGLEWYLGVFPWMRELLPAKVLRAIDYREGKQ